MHNLFFDESNKLRSGWRAAIFLFAFTFILLTLSGVEQAIFSALHLKLPPGSIGLLAINETLSFSPAIVIGWLCGKLLEGLPFRAIGVSLTAGWFKHWLLGIFVGALTLSFAVALAAVFGGLRFQVNAGTETSSVVTALGTSFLVFAVAAAAEESLFRGYLLQTFSRSGFAALAVVLTSIFFGLVHLRNPNAGFISTSNTILAGIWFGIAYLKTRDLWFVWGIHLMWNWMQLSFFGIEVSGLTDFSKPSLLLEIDRGPFWLTGENYGIEGGIACTFALILSMGLIYFLPYPKPNAEMLAMSEPSTDLTPPVS